MSDPTNFLQCERHGQTPVTYVCTHLRFGVGCGYHGSTDDVDDRWPDAWCDLCDAELQRDGGWSESSSPELAALCTGCYDTVKLRNAYIPAPIVPGQLSVSTAEFDELAHQTCERCKLRQEQVRRQWPAFGASKRWYWDPDASTLRFYDRRNGASLLSDVRTVGTFSTRTSTWMWTWGNEHWPDAARAEMDPIRVFGEVREIEKLRLASWKCEEVDAWEVAQIAADLLGAAAVYRAPMDHLLVFMLLDGFRSSHDSWSES